jgi:hypothetical protein
MEHVRKYQELQGGFDGEVSLGDELICWHALLLFVVDRGALPHQAGGCGTVWLGGAYNMISVLHYLVPAKIL